MAYMTLVDERAVVPPLDEAALERLASACDHEDVIAAMLIGSQARGNPGTLSDIDVGVWHAPGLDAGSRLRLRLDLSQQAAKAVGSNEVDIILLNDASPLMRHRAIRDRRLLLQRDPKTRVRLETRALIDYLDTAPLRAELARGLRHRIEEGRFGRRRER
jgi:uncharacterized protein